MNSVNKKTKGLTTKNKLLNVKSKSFCLSKIQLNKKEKRKAITN